MKLFDPTILFSLSIFIAGIIALVRFRKIKDTYYPFIFLIWPGCLSEIIGYYLVFNNHPNIISSNLFTLAESGLMLWFLRNLGVFKKAEWLMYGLIALFGATWLYENFIRNDFGTAFNSYFNIIYAFPVVLLSINAINNILVSEKEILKNASFLISIGIIIFFTYRVLIEAFWLYGVMSSSEQFMAKVYAIMGYINLLCNLIYALAVLWMQKKQVFTLQF